MWGIKEVEIGIRDKIITCAITMNCYETGQVNLMNMAAFDGSFEIF